MVKREDLDTEAVARFFDKVSVRGADECWPWLASVDTRGYGQFRVFPKPARPSQAHHVAFVLSGQLYQDGAVIRHGCDTPRCVNPKHLSLGTHADNVADKVKRGRQAKGERNGRSKLNPTLVREIRSYAKAGKSSRTLAGWYGVDAKAISNVVDRGSWRDVD